MNARGDIRVFVKAEWYHVPGYKGRCAIADQLKMDLGEKVVTVTVDTKHIKIKMRKNRVWRIYNTPVNAVQFLQEFDKLAALAASGTDVSAMEVPAFELRLPRTAVIETRPERPETKTGRQRAQARAYRKSYQEVKGEKALVPTPGQVARAEASASEAAGKPVKFSAADRRALAIASEAAREARAEGGKARRVPLESINTQ